MSIERQRLNFATNPEDFLTKVVDGLVRDPELADCLLVYAYDCISLQAPILDYSDLPSVADMDEDVPDKLEENTPRDVSDVGDLGLSQSVGGRRRKQKNRGGMPPRAAAENVSLRRVVKFTVLLTLLTSTLGIGYITVACIKNLAALYGFDTVTVKLLESIIGLGGEVASQTLSVSAITIRTGLQLSGSVASLLSSLGIRVVRIAGEGGRLMQMTPLIMMSRYINNSQMLFQEMRTFGGSIQGVFRTIVNTAGAGIGAVNATLQAVKGTITGSFAELRRVTGAASATAQQGVTEFNGNVERAVDRIMGFLSDQHKEELNGFFEAVEGRMGAAPAMAGEGIAIALAPPAAFVRFLKDISADMFEGIVDLLIDVDLEEAALSGPSGETAAARRERAAAQYDAQVLHRTGDAFLVDEEMHDMFGPEGPRRRYLNMPPPPPRSPGPGGKRSRKRRKTRRKKSRKH